MSTHEALTRLREAIISDVSEDNQAIGELSDWHSDLVTTFNDVPGVKPITDADLA